MADVLEFFHLLNLLLNLALLSLVYFDLHVQLLSHFLELLQQFDLLPFHYEKLLLCDLQIDLGLFSSFFTIIVLLLELL